MSAPTSPATRICVWSGPRNVSTALMRSFEARGDCAVIDEPLYAAFLRVTGKDHPGREQVMASQPTDPRVVLAQLRVPRDDVAYVFEKHMAHHWQPGWALDAFGPARHVLLIRDPARVVASYARVRQSPIPEDLGYDRQLELFGRLRGGDPPEELAPLVVDGDALLTDPPRVLRALCGALDLAYTDKMLAWPRGRRATDGVWAPWWYAAVEHSTGFEAARPPGIVPPELAWVVDAVRPAYERLAARCLSTGP